MINKITSKLLAAAVKVLSELICSTIKYLRREPMAQSAIVGNTEFEVMEHNNGNNAEDVRGDLHFY
jgi:hypothetical protein